MLGVTLTNYKEYSTLLCEHCRPIKEGDVVFIHRCGYCNLFKTCKHNINKYELANCKFCQCHLKEYFYPYIFKEKLNFGDMN